ncbi:MAG TPA: hypothetical protein VNY27_10585 [Solirubrobacteraceae bacterium]|nr:hypothetical protein [Solirubrobacteraceae bacterium]
MSVSSEVRRTLVKSPPELWAELSDPASLARHLGELGEIHIVRTEPDRAVDWEAAAADGAHASGRVAIEPSGWGTRVTLSASRTIVAPEREPEPEPAPVEVAVAVEPEPEPEVIEPEPRPGFFARFFRRRRQPVPVPELTIEPEPEPIAEVEIAEPEIAEPAPQEAAPEPDISAELAELEQQTTAMLTGVLDRLGAAHHRPFSRA